MTKEQRHLWEAYSTAKQLLELIAQEEKAADKIVPLTETLEHAIKDIRDSKLVPELPTGVREMEEGSGIYHIDLSRFEAHDLEKLDLSKLDKFKFSVSDHEKFSHCSYDLSSVDKYQQIPMQIRKFQNILQESYKFETLKHFPDAAGSRNLLFRSYIDLQSYKVLDKTMHDSPQDLNLWLNIQQGGVNHLIECNREAGQLAKKQEDSRKGKGKARADAESSERTGLDSAYSLSKEQFETENAMAISMTEAYLEHIYTYEQKLPVDNKSFTDLMPQVWEHIDNYRAGRSGKEPEDFLIKTQTLNAELEKFAQGNPEEASTSWG